MSRERPTLTAAVQQQICAFIRAGGFPEVAAEAAGVPAEVFADWLRRGRGKRAGKRYQALVAAATQAEAQARLAAELQVFEKRPLEWLKCGPGKENEERLGWTAAAKATPRREAEPINWLEHPEVIPVLRALLEALTPFPEARAAAAQVLAGLPAPSQEPGV